MKFCLYLSTACKWLCLQIADPFAYTVSAFAFPQKVSDCACMQAADPFAYCVFAFAFPQSVSDCACMQAADPFAYGVSAFAFPQRVSDCACKLEIPLLMVFLPLPSYRV